MSPSAPFIRRPVATTLLTLGIALAGMLAFRLLPVSPLPQVDFPTIRFRQPARERVRRPWRRPWPRRWNARSGASPA
jgi:hypothetical protein